MSDHMQRIAIVSVLTPIAYWVVVGGLKWIIGKLMKDGPLKRILFYKMYD